MSKQYEVMLAVDIGNLIELYMTAGKVTGIEVIEALQVNIKGAEHANETVLKIANRIAKPEATKAAQDVVFGESKGQA